ncbi:MAG: DegT/DnrJ/EryC1/StrS family aminotransferase [Thermodesulfobacteriota bacterium]
MTIPFIDLKTQYRAMEKEMRAAIEGVLAHGGFIMGPEIGRLEAELARFAGVKHALGCASGTDALLLPLMALGVGPGDAVFTPTFTFIATAEVVSFLGATPVFVDSDPLTFNLDPDSLEKALARVEAKGRLRPAGVIPVDLFGLPADYGRLEALARARGLFLLEDAAQGFGGRYHGRPAGSLGRAGATSFFPAKPLGCYGDGGAVFTDDDGLDEIMRSLRVHGQGENKYENVRVGLNARMDTLQAAILLVKLAAFPAELEARRRVAARYTRGLAGHVQTPAAPDGLVSSWAQYSVLTDRRDAVMAALKQDGIPTAVYYPKPLHLQKAFAGLGYGPGDFPVAESLSRRIFSLPMHPYLEDQTIDRIVERVIAAL